MGKSGNKWIVLVAAIWVQCFAGIGYVFGTISPIIKSTLGFNQKQINVLGVAKDLGDSIGLLAGLLSGRLPTSAVLFVGALQNIIGYGWIWLVVSGKVPSLPFWMVCALIYIGTNGETYFNTAALVSCVQTFPNARGPIVGILKGFTGLSGAILTQVYATFYAPDQAAFIFMIAVGPFIVAISMMFVLRPLHPSHKGKDPSDDARFNFIYAVCMVLAAYLLGVMILQDIINVKHSLNLAFVVILAVILCLPILLPIEAKFRPRQDAPELEAPLLVGPLKVKVYSPRSELKSPSQKEMVRGELKSPLQKEIVEGELTPTSLAQKLRKAWFTGVGNTSRNDVLKESVDAPLVDEVTIYKSPRSRFSRQNLALLEEAMREDEALRESLLKEQDTTAKQENKEEEEETTPPELSKLRSFWLQGLTSFRNLKSKNGPHRGEDFTLLQGVVKADLWLLFFALICGGGSGLTIIDNMGQISESQGYANGHIFVSMISIWNFLGRIGGGFLSEIVARDYAYPRPVTIAVSQVIMAIGQLVFAGAWPGSMYAGTLLVGLGYGAHWSIVPATVSELFGLNNFGSFYNFITMANPAGSLVFSGLIAGSIYDREAEKQQHSGLGSDSSNTLKCTGAVCFFETHLIMAAVCVLGVTLSLILSYRTATVYTKLYAKESLRSSTLPASSSPRKSKGKSSLTKRTPSKTKLSSLTGNC